MTILDELAEVSDAIDDYAGLMTAGSMLQRQGIAASQRQSAAATQKLVELQHRQINDQAERDAKLQRLAEQQHKIIKKEHDRKLAIDKTTQECRQLISYTTRILDHLDLGEFAPVSYTHLTLPTKRIV